MVTPNRYNDLVRLNRLIKFINSLIGLVILAAIAATWWYGWRPLPQTSGTLAAPLAAPASIQRDAHGLPLIEAKSLDDLLFAQGFATAQDRLWQMESLRRAATGTLSEVIGPNTLPIDRETRSLRMARIAERQLAALSPADRATLAAYARGVNHYIRTQRGNYPIEFRLLGFDPRPWRIEDSLSIGLLMFRSLSSTGRIELQKALLLEKGDPEKINLLFSSTGGQDVQPGSNAWALSGTRTASGKALLANDPHLEHSLPGTWHAVHLRGDGLDVFGFTVPGIPGVVIGRNPRIAWGITNLGFDSQDYFLEQLDPNTGRYLYKGQVLQAELDRELIPVKNAPGVEFKQWVTVHGPVSTIGNRQAALQWTAAVPAPFQLSVLALNRATNWTEFRAALEHFPSASSNFVYADAEGNIGLQVAGQLPIRRNRAGDVPVEGTSGEFDWEGFIPFADLPSFYNPPSGRVLTANQNPFPADYKYTVSGDFAPPYRARQIADRLDSQEIKNDSPEIKNPDIKKWTPADTMRLQADVYSGFSHHLAAHVIKAWQRRQASDPNLAPAIELLKQWNGQMMPELPAPLVITYTYQNLRRMVIEKAARQPGANYELRIGPAHIESLLDRQTPGWFPDWDAVLLRALGEGIEEGQRAQGTDIRKWRYGIYNQITIRHPLLERIPYVGAYFNLGPYQANGSSTTLKQTSPRLLPSMRFVADFGPDPAGGLYHLPAGLSGHAFSSHFKDQWRAYQSAEGFPLNAPAADTLILQPTP